MYEKHFMDCNEEPRRWDVNFNLGTARKIQQDLAVYILNALDIDAKGNLKSDVLERLKNDPGLLVDVLFICCEKQAAERNVSAEEFGYLFVSGEMIENATNALLQGILDLQPTDKREILTHILKMGEKMKNSMIEEGKKILNDPKTQAAIEAELKNVLSAPQTPEK